MSTEERLLRLEKAVCQVASSVELALYNLSNVEDASIRDSDKSRMEDHAAQLQVLRDSLQSH
jgi:hypothetical protein